jgi:hypothetical protein
VVDVTPILSRRNARPRAWRAHGMPLTARWETRFQHLSASFTARCDTRGREARTSLAEGDAAQVFDIPGLVRALEGQAVHRIIRDGVRPCPYLAPLLGEDPPEVVEITELEPFPGEPPP